MADQTTSAFILRDEAGEFYAIPPAALAAYRVPAEHRAAVERVAADAGDLDTAEPDTAGFAQGQGAALGRGHGGGNPHYLAPVVSIPLPLPFPTGITDGTSNTILFGER